MKTQFKKIGTGVALATASIGSAVAAVPAEVTTAISDAKTDALVVAGAVLVVIVAIYAFKLMRKAL